MLRRREKTFAWMSQQVYRKEAFLKQLEASTGSDGRQYTIQRLNQAKYTLSATDPATPITVISLEGATV